MSITAHPAASAPNGTGHNTGSSARAHSRRGAETPDAIFGQISAASAVKIAVAIVGPLVCALGVLGGIGSFATVRHLATPWFGGQAWIVPVGVDVGILALLAWDLLAEYLGLSWPLLRWAAWTFIATTVYLNIAAAHGNVTASIMHAAMPVIFVTVVEGIRHLIRQCTGIVTGTRIERIPVSRWLLAPRTSFLLVRRMVLWHVTSYRDGLQLEFQRSVQVAQLQERYGRWLWRWRAPLQDRLALRLTPADAVLSLSGSSAAAPEQLADIPDRPDDLLAQLPRRCLVELPKPTATPLSDSDERLINAATVILREASGQGKAISQAALARKLRADGHSIGNDRLRWLTVTAHNRLPGEQPD
jgi:hypothetical protein